MYRQSALTGIALLLLTLLSTVAPGQNRSPEMNTSAAAPVISIETSVPGEINIGASAQFVISVKNSGKSIAEGVSIQTKLPPTVKFVKASPEPTAANDRLVQFEVGDLPPGTVRRFNLELIPQKTGPVDLQTKAFFSASTQSELQVRQPEIAIKCGGPETALFGEIVTFTVVVENVGDGPAQDVVLTPHLPEGSFIEAQPPQAAKLASLGARKSQEFKFTARANQPEFLEGTFAASAHANRDVQCSHRVKILRPDLRVEMGGTRVGFVGSQGEYAIRTWNPGDIVLHDVKVTLQVPAGLDITTVSEEGCLDPEHRLYTWCLRTLNPGESHAIQLKAKATKVGRQVQRVDAKTAPQLQSEASHLTHVTSRADVEVSVTNTREAIPVGEAEKFTVSVVNHGSKTAEAVKVTIRLPEGVQPLTTDGATTADQEVRMPAFRLNPAESKSLTFRAVSLKGGDHAVRATVETEFASVPIVAETVVYFYDEEELQRIARELDATIRLR